MTNRSLLFLSFLLLLAVVCSAADVSGKWTAQVPGRDGQMREQVYNFKADGDKLTGTVTFGQSDAPIADGKVSGDSITFTLTREFGGNSIKWTYNGVVSGDEIKFKREGGQGPAREFVAKRSK